MNNTDDKVERLIAEAGLRSKPPEDAHERVYEATLKAWKNAEYSAEYGLRYKRRLIAIAASVLLSLSFAVLNYLPSGRGSEDPSFLLSYSSGALYIDGQPAGHATKILRGSTIETDGAAFAEIERGDGLLVRIDENSSLDIVDSFEIELHSGRVYIDSEGEGRISVLTDYGIVRDIGTQFEVSVIEDGVLATVRDGEIYIKTDSGSYLSAANEVWGESTQLRKGESPVVSKVSRTSEHWKWLASASAPIDMEGKTLDSLLIKISRELGLRLKYRNVVVENNAKVASLHGTLYNRDDDFLGALKQVMRTTKLKATVTDKNELLIDFRSE